MNGATPLPAPSSMPVGEMTIHPSVEFVRALRVVIDDNGGLETEAAIHMAVANEARRLENVHRERCLADRLRRTDATCERIDGVYSGFPQFR